jgi:DNA adenine methylase
MGRVNGVPHPFPYQGSKRQLATQIVACIPPSCGRVVEPFAGSAAITLAAAALNRAERYWINDLHSPLAALWRAITTDPDHLATSYTDLWYAQRGRERTFFDMVRDRFNVDHAPAHFLYLLARCVKAAVRFNVRGEFNNSPDNRRLGMHPDTMRTNLRRTAELLRDRVEVTSLDYRVVLDAARADDLVYMDPPYQGVSAVRDHRYFGGIEFDSFVEALAGLNRRGIAFLVSYDGRTGEKVHGRPLPPSLGLSHHELAVGQSSQATLLGRTELTVESLYLSPALVTRLRGVPKALTRRPTPSLFE